MRFPNRVQVLLIGGHSGTGKSILARSLSQKLGFPALQVDDFRLAFQRVIEGALEKKSVSESLWDHLGLGGIRDIHFFYNNRHSAPESRFGALKATAEAMSNALEIVLAHHIATQTPVIIEGDGLVPSLLTRRPIANLDPLPGQLRGIFLVEDDEAQLMRAAKIRDRGFNEIDLIEQQQIIRASWLFGQWLKEEADKHAVPVIRPLPYETLVERVLKAVQYQPGLP